MILVVLGTQDKKFIRLLKIVENAKKKGIINDEVIVQAGKTKYKSDILDVHSFFTSKDFDKYMKQCDLLITHGGVGNIVNGLLNKKKILVMPRLKLYKEHKNDHQEQITDKFVKLGYVRRIDSFDDLVSEYTNIDKFRPKFPKFDNSKMIDILSEFIER